MNMTRNPTNYRIGAEPLGDKGSLFHPAMAPSNPRSLRTPESFAPERYAPGTPPIPEEWKVPGDIPELAGIPEPYRSLVKAMEAALRRRPLVCQEYAFDFWRVDLINLTPLASVWLDEFFPAGGGAQRFIDKRRAVTIVNHSQLNPVWVRHSEQAVIQGGYIPPWGSISIPLSSRAKIFGQGQAAGNTAISFYQFA